MLTKSEIDQLHNLDLSLPTSPSESDVTTQLDRTIAELRDNKGLNLDGDDVTILVLQTLKELLRRTAPRTLTIPASDMTDFEFVIDPDPLDPVGKTMNFDSAYDA